MKRRTTLLFATLLVFATLAAGPRDSKPAGTTAVPGSPAALTRVAKGKAPRVKSVTLLIGSRVFADFKDLTTVPLNKEFPVGSSNYTARVVEYVPDFAIDTKQHKVVSRSSEPRNPAVMVVVREKGVPQDTSWAFANFPPHFSRRSLLSFRLLGADFFDAAPLRVAFDTTGTDSAKARTHR